ncbi:arsenate reductase (glutaredoxin) [Wenzhouxiangella sp. AB-CW3]|uniref:arsenate reductase (glutaredoxin) n=1 Tax=Wenzhouxiangella sp. AB-CW3 TaxID=2771012 RepID=UPI00168BD631|nr:arsenate reductase (glutaredoxin) [Wenzhouxiangella sp. AB-CW3]QOC22989.1 arsenate reductase (glutaredoxin) [Wenzhouxiangella sp. AB-CW3]
MPVTIFHNPRCSKSRQTLALLRDHGIKPDIVEYLKTPPEPAELKRIIDRLGLTARQLLRTGEPEYRDQGLADETLTEQSVIETMCRHPRLIQRPIVIAGEQARIGRPPEAVVDILP